MEGERVKPPSVTIKISHHRDLFHYFSELEGWQKNGIEGGGKEGGYRVRNRQN